MSRKSSVVAQGVHKSADMAIGGGPAPPCKGRNNPSSPGHGLLADRCALRQADAFMTPRRFHV